ncbi:MAG TPA: tyrosine-type recombinase/integrase [Gaiellaceae bacterium]|nr:tyrosine-type recombinase/integrase [Gaiellaceae bacterium]
MPARQRGSVVRRDATWEARWYDETGRRRALSGFETKTAALDWLDTKLKEVVALRRGDLLPASHRPKTVGELCDLFLERHGATVDVATKKKLTRELRQARSVFGERHPDSLHRLEIEDWRATISRGSRHNVFRAFRQALAWAHARGLTEREPSAGIKNPKPKRHERKPIVPFETWDEIDAIAKELDERYRAIAAFAAGTGLRPEEWIALERDDIDREARIVRVYKRFSGGALKQGTKTVPERFVPLRQRVLDELDEHRKRLAAAALKRRSGRVQLDSKLLFPAPRGGYIDIERFRLREWYPALRAAGLAQRGVYTMRHSFATWAIEDASIPLPQLATIMGTSIREIEDTYRRWLRRTDERLLAALDAYDAAATGTALGG